MLLLKNNKLINVDTSEDSDIVVTAVMTAEELCYKYAIRDVIYTLIMHTSGNVPEHYGKYNFKVTQSQYADESSLNNYYMVFNTKGEAISRMLKDGFTVYINGIKFEK